MGRKTVIECDNCGTEQEEAEAGMWLNVDVSALNNDTNIHEQPTFCSYKCMGEWAAEREARLQPA
jgi:hypothetical protein